MFRFVTATHARTRLLPAVLCLLLGCLPLLIPWSAGAATPEVLRAIHTDALHTTYDGTSLKLATRIGTGDYREADPAGLIFNLEDRGSARVELPDAPPFAFLGKPGDPVWIAPESQDPELIWPGWDTETIAAGMLRDDTVDLTLVDAEGPGAVEVFFNYDEFTGVVPRLFSSIDPAYRTVHQPVGRHVHANWSFSALGTYRLTFQASAATAAGAPVTSGPVVYTFVVGPYEPPTTPPTTPSPTPTTTPPTTPPSTSPTSPPSTTPSSTPTTTPTTTPPACVTAVLSVGHVDVAARTVGNRLRFQVKDGTRSTPVWRDPGTVAFQVKPSADEVVPPSASYRFLGPAGATVWQIPQTQATDLLWAGWNTESVDYTALNGPVRWSLDKVIGPGKVAVYQFNQFGEPLISFDSGKKLPQSITLAGPTHAHGNWAFTKLGLYKLTFTYSATTKSGQTLHDTATLPVVVGNDLSTLCPGGPTPTAAPTSPASTPTPTQHRPSTAPTSAPTNPRTTKPAIEPTSDAPPRPTSSLRPCTTTSQTTTPSASTAASSSTSASATSTTPAGTTLTNGHADYAVRLEGGSVTSRLKDGTQAGAPVWRDPASVVVRLTSAAATTAPGGAFAFLGAAGTPIWQIPQTQKSGVVWLGWNTEELTAAQVYGGGVDWRLDKLTGPGALAVFEFDSFGQPKVIFNSADGLPDTYRVPLGTHAHGNWTFTKPGTYHATFTHTATLANGKTSSDTATLTFSVGNSGGARSINAHTPAAASASTPSASVGARPVSDNTASTTDCKLAMTGGGIGFGWIVAAAVVLVLGVVLLAATRRGNR
jgi:surface-anchored protein